MRKPGMIIVIIIALVFLAFIITAGTLVTSKSIARSNATIERIDQKIKKVSK